MVSNEKSDGWRVAFKFQEGTNLIDLELIGDEAAIRFGLALAGATLKPKVEARLSVGQLPDGLLEEATKLLFIQQGAPITEFEGQFLEVEPVKRVRGLKSSLQMKWSD